MSGFRIKFDKNTIDHLGIKLYSQFPPVIAELISNAYDADAEHVKININYNNRQVIIIDDGNGMTYDEINDCFLVIGRNRRDAMKTDVSPVKGRKVTGRKGLGKLAVFGIASEIELVSIKDNLKNGFSINYNELKASEFDEYHPKVIYQNEATDEPNGTQITIRSILQKNITSVDNLAVSLAKRFSLFSDDFVVTIASDTSKEPIQVSKKLSFDEANYEFTWSFPKDFRSEIISNSDLALLESCGITGKVFTAGTPLRASDNGFLIFVRNKLASEHIFFNSRSNDQFNSYVTGFFHVDCIDDFDEDLISTARQSILWDSNQDIMDIQHALDQLIRIIGKQWREKRKSKKEELLVLDEDFFEGLSPIEIESIKKVKSIMIANSVEGEDVSTVKSVLENMKSLFQFESFQEYITRIKPEDITVENVEKITSDWEYLEAKELAKVALGRIKAIEKFKSFIESDASETKVIQPFLEKFPWILDSRITTFQREVHFRDILRENFKDDSLAESNRRLDFLCNLVNGELIIIELKRPRIKISYKEIKQCRDYERFLLAHHKAAIEKGIKTFLISDRYDMADEAKDIYESFEKDGKLTIKSYSDLLAQAIQYNNEFINKFHELESYKKGGVDK